jgi:hypothetical protein
LRGGGRPRWCAHRKPLTAKRIPVARGITCCQCTDQLISCCHTLIRPISTPHACCSGANYVRQQVSLREHLRRGNAAPHPDRRATVSLACAA